MRQQGKLQIAPLHIDDFPCVNNIAEPMLIQVFIAKAAIKTLYKPVLCRLTGLDKPQLHAMHISPLIKGFTGKLRPLASYFRRRIAAKQRNAVQNTRNLNA